MASANPLHAFKLDHSGVARVFGALEAEIMECVWELGEPTVAQVCDRLTGSAGSKSLQDDRTAREPANYKTVMTVMNRLVDKHVLTRRRESRAFIYAPVETRAAFLERVSRSVADGLVQEFGALALAQFVDAVDAVDPDLLAKLERLVRERQSGL
jgi:predicted transcriptional regulator